MQNFADQCLDMAESILGNNLGSINEDGSVAPVDNEEPRIDESGHAALAIGEYYRATEKETHGEYDLVDLNARCITYQAFNNEEENGLAFSSLGLLAFGANKQRNEVWERLLDPTREKLDSRLLARTDYDNHYQAFNIAKAVARYTLGLSKKDETGKLIERFLSRIDEKSSTGYFDDHEEGFGGSYDIYGIFSFVFIRQALQLHGNINLRERKLPSLRTYAEKYLKLIPDLVRSDGMGMVYGRSIGAYGQMHCISLILQGLRDGWITNEKKPMYLDALRRLFYYFFVNYLDQEHGYLVVRDSERATVHQHTTRMANFDAARYLCQWSRLAQSIGGELAVAYNPPAKSMGRFVICDKDSKKEQGLFLYKDPVSKLHIQMPLMGGNDDLTSDYLTFPHCPGIFDWPTNKYLPIMMPELTFGEDKVIPSYYGRKCTTGLGIRNSFYFRFEQPELITTDKRLLNGLGSCKVCWTFQGNKITSEFVFQVKNQVQMDKMRYVIALGCPHSRYRIGTTLCLGEEGQRANVIKDDFQATWLDTEVVTEDMEYRGYHGNIHYLQTLTRDHPLIMRPNQQYRLTVSFEPDVVTAEG